MKILIFGFFGFLDFYEILISDFWKFGNFRIFGFLDFGFFEKIFKKLDFYFFVPEPALTY